MYEKNLHVCDTNGVIIRAEITPRRNGTVLIQLPYIKAVAEDKALGVPTGMIRKVVPKEDFAKVIDSITQYLESLFLMELSNEDNNPSQHGTSKPRGVKVKTDSEPVKQREGKGHSSLHDSGGRGKPSGSPGRRKPKSKLAEGSDSESKG